MIHLPSRPTRRRMLQTSAGALLAGGLWPGRAWADAAPDAGAFTFLCVNDLHYFDKKGDDFFQRMVRQMNDTEDKGPDGKARARPDFCLVLGDFAEDGTAEQLGAMRDHLKGLKMPTKFVVGNHDYVELDGRKPFEELFPGPPNYAFDHKGWQFVGLDTTHGRRGSKTAVQAPTLDWLKDNVPKLDKKRPTVLFTHFPMGWLVPSQPTNADAVLTPFKEYNLQAAFCGHFHASTERHKWDATITTNKCCSFYKPNHDFSKDKGYFLCHAKDGDVSRAFVEVRATP